VACAWSRRPPTYRHAIGWLVREEKIARGELAARYGTEELSPRAGLTGGDHHLETAGPSETATRPRMSTRAYGSWSTWKQTDRAGVLEVGRSGRLSPRDISLFSLFFSVFFFFISKFHFNFKFKFKYCAKLSSNYIVKIEVPILEIILHTYYLLYIFYISFLFFSFSPKSSSHFYFILFLFILLLF
jgi:hypothetical protein